MLVGGRVVHLSQDQTHGACTPVNVTKCEISGTLLLAPYTGIARID